MTYYLKRKIFTIIEDVFIIPLTLMKTTIVMPNHYVIYVLREQTVLVLCVRAEMIMRLIKWKLCHVSLSRFSYKNRNSNRDLEGTFLKKKHCIIKFILLLQIYSSICQVMLNDLRVILNLFKMDLNRNKKHNQFNDYIFKNNTFPFSYSVKIKHLIHLFLKWRIKYSVSL